MRFVIALSCLLGANVCFGHGHPIRVDVSGGQLIVSGGMPLSFGAGRQAFDDHEDSYLEDFGDVFYGTTPGFNVHGMEPGSELRLEILARPDFSLPSTPDRWLWFWSKSNQQVGTAPNSPTLEVASQEILSEFVILTQFEPPDAASSLLVMEPLPSEIGTHQHPLAYFLDNIPTAEFGAYGFFARVTSPNYDASEPFLIALNHSLSTEENGLAARAINSSAALPGDFNGDNNVDGDDFLAWQRSFGSTTELSADGSLNGTADADDLAIWKANFGRTWPVSGIGVAAVVPEPSTLCIAMLMLAAFAARRQRAVRMGCRE